MKTVSVDGLENPDVHVFRVTLSEKERADVAKVLGAHDTILIATAKEAVWYAAGRDAESALKAIVQASVADGENDGETEEESPDIVRGLVSVKPWLQLRDKLFPRSNEDSAVAGTPEERQRQVLLKSLRKHVDESLTNENGRVRFRLRRDGNGVSGESTVGIGLLRALGKFITQYAAENLQ
ncbi:MAG: hypothetical protein D6725_08900 [Planctomycetota bacterium]|nr:MAG: hypothetical protein D6725_08900 [Planctomycetota bacterium]